jgi:hypothetical protein
VGSLQDLPAIKGEYPAWAGRRLDRVTLNYLFLNASFFRMHSGFPAEPALAAWDVTTSGKPAFIGDLATGTGRNSQSSPITGSARWPLSTPRPTPRR